MCSRKDRSYVRSPDKKKLLNFTFEKFNTEFSSRASFYTLFFGSAVVIEETIAALNRQLEWQQQFV